VIRGTYVSTSLTELDSMAASSFTKWGRFPVFCSCTITPSTISSLIPSKSISLFTSHCFKPSASGSGDGGGVFSYFIIVFDSLFAGGDIGDGDSELCDRFIFLDGGSVEFVEGGERAAARDACETGR
jgi:hypothetical protein